MNLTNYHTHTFFSDGSASMEEYVQVALRQSFSALGFSDHAPIPGPGATIDEKKWRQYRQAAKDIEERFRSQLDIFCGLEVDFIPGRISPQSDFIKQLDLDYTIGAVHFVDAFPDGTPWNIDGSYAVFEAGLNQLFDGDIHLVIQRYFQVVRDMVSSAPPSIVAHLDRIRRNLQLPAFGEDDDWYQREVNRTLECIAEAGCILEVNTKAMYGHNSYEPYPSRWIIEMAVEMGIPLHLASDAHHPADLSSSFERAQTILTETGCRELQVLTRDGWQATNLKSHKRIA